jgi:PAS domain S-box-containing protein
MPYEIWFLKQMTDTLCETTLDGKSTATVRARCTWQKLGSFLSGSVIAVILSLFASGASQAQTSVNQPGATIRDHPPASESPNRTLVVGSEQDYPPFATGMTDETAGGFTVDLWKAVAAEAGLKYTIRTRPFREIFQEFKEGKIDVLINLAVSDERRQFAGFTVPHVIVNGAIFVRKGESTIRSEDDLAGKSIIVLNADLGHDYAVAKGWQKQLVLVDTSAEGFRLLASGKHDAMLLSKLTGMQTVQALGLTNIEALKAKAGFSQKFAFAVHKSQPDLLAALNEGLALSKSNGTYNKLYEKWFGIYETKEVGLSDLLKYIVPVVLVFMIILGYFLYLRQRERRASATKLRTLFTAIEQSPASVVITDLEPCIQYVNPKFTEVTGYTAAEAIGQNPRILKSGQVPKDMYVQLWDKIGNGQPWHGELINKRKNGEVYWEDVHIAPVTSLTGAASHYVAVKTDISERKQAEEALRNSTDLLRSVMENVPARIFWKDRHLRYMGCNTTFANDAGYSNADEVIGKTDFEMGWRDQAELYRADDKSTIESGKSKLHYDEPQTTPDGNAVWLRTSKVPLRDENSQIIGVLGIYEDITARKQAEAELLQHRNHLEELVAARTSELEQSRDAAEAGNRAKTIFLTNMSHELRTPMNGVMGMTDLALLRATDPKQIDMLNKSKGAAQRMINVVNDILDFSKAEAERLPLEEKNFSLSLMIGDVVAMQDIIAEAKGLTLIREIPAAFPDQLSGDVFRLRQILLNFVGNACKFSDQGTITVRVSAVEQDSDSVLARIEVEDEGIGISPEQQAILFQPFTQADGSMSRKYGGSGLGLAIAKRLANLMGGDVGVVSQEGHGSTFWATVRLKLTKASEVGI